MEITKKSIILNSNVNSALKALLSEFWFAPMDAYLRAFEVAIWKKIKFKKPTLDIGCGDGRIDTLLFSGKSIEVGLDPSKKAIIFAKNNILYKEVVVGRAENILYKNGSFNTVILNSTFEHIKGDLKAIKEISRVLRIGGVLNFTTTTKNMKSELDAIFSDSNEFKKFNKRVEHFHYRSLDEWREILLKNNLVILEHFTYFTKNDLRKWLTLFKIFTYQFKDRELWSYLKDSKFSKYLPSNFISMMEYKILLPLLDDNMCEEGMWQFISAKKVS